MGRGERRCGENEEESVGRLDKCVRVWGVEGEGGKCAERCGKCVGVWESVGGGLGKCGGVGEVCRGVGKCVGVRGEVWISMGGRCRGVCWGARGGLD